MCRLPGADDLQGIEALSGLELLEVVGGPWLNSFQSPNWQALAQLPRLVCLSLCNPMRLSNQSLAVLDMKKFPERSRLALRYGLQYQARDPIRTDIFHAVDDGLCMVVPILK